MNEKLKALLMEKMGADKRRGDFNDQVFEFLYHECDEVYRESLADRRWWKDLFVVVDVGDGVLLGFNSASTTGDDSPRDKGWEFDPDTICEVEKVTEMKEVTTYIAKYPATQEEIPLAAPTPNTEIKP